MNKILSIALVVTASLFLTGCRMDDVRIPEEPAAPMMTQPAEKPDPATTDAAEPNSMENDTNGTAPNEGEGEPDADMDAFEDSMKELENMDY